MDVLEAYKKAGKDALYIALGDVLVGLVKAGLEKIPNNPVRGPYAKLVGGLAFPLIAQYVRNPQLKTVLEMAGAVGIWFGVKELLEERGMYPLSGNKVLNYQVLVPPPEVVLPPVAHQEEKKVQVLGSPEITSIQVT